MHNDIKKNEADILADSALSMINAVLSDKNANFDMNSHS